MLIPSETSSFGFNRSLQHHQKNKIEDDCNGKKLRLSGRETQGANLEFWRQGVAMSAIAKDMVKHSATVYSYFLYI